MQVAENTRRHTLEMIITFSNDLINGNGLEIPPRMTWMDGLTNNEKNRKEDNMHYGLKILFVLMCSPRANDKKLKSLDDFLNGSNFSLDKISSMSIQEISDEIRQIGMQNKNAFFIQQAFQKIKHLYGGVIPRDALVLKNNFEGIGMKIALLITQYVYGIVQVSVVLLFHLRHHFISFLTKF